MDLHLLTTLPSQLRGTSDLYLLTAQDGLPSKLNAFLLAGKVGGLAPATLQNYQYHLEAFIRFCSVAGLNDTQNITAHHIRLFLLSLQERNSPVSVLDYYKSTKRFFNWLIEEGFLEESPMQKIKSPRVPKTIIKPFSDEDIKKLLSLCSGERFLDIRNRVLVLLFLDTALRVSEAAKIKLDDIDFNQETIRVMGKGAKERVVRVGKVTQKALLRYLLSRQDTSDYLWVTEEKKPMTKDGLQCTIKVMCLRAGITGVKKGPHTFRHTAAIKYLRNGGDVFTLQIMLGHSTLKMTRRYVASLGADDMIKVHQKASPVDNMKL